MRDANFVFLFCHFAYVHLCPTASHVELAAGSVFGAVVFLITRGRPVAPLARKV